MEHKANAAISRAKKAEESAKIYRTKLYNANRRVARAATILAQCRQESADLRQSLRREVEKGKKLLSEAARSLERSRKGLRSEIAHLRRHAAMLQAECRAYKDEVRILRVRVARFPTICENKVKAALWKARHTTSLTSQGVYTPECRALVLDLCASGVPDKAVGSVIASFARTFGIHLSKVPSARTVGLIKIEGGIASKIQTVHEMLLTKGKHLDWPQECILPINV